MLFAGQGLPRFQARGQWKSSPLSYERQEHLRPGLRIQFLCCGSRKCIKCYTAGRNDLQIQHHLFRKPQPWQNRSLLDYTSKSEHQSVSHRPRSGSIAHVIKNGLERINESVAEFFIDKDGQTVLTAYAPMSVLSLFHGNIQEELETAYTELLGNLLNCVENAKNNPHLLQKYLWVSQHIIMYEEKIGDLTEQVKAVESRIVSYMTENMSLEKVTHQCC